MIKVQRVLRFWFTMTFVAAFLIATNQRAAAQEIQGGVEIGGTPVATILEKLGAQLESGISPDQLNRYVRQFDIDDNDGDGQHSEVEYIDNGTYLTPQARRGIFGAADNDGDSFVTRAEYILNRIITDEAKNLVQVMDDDNDGVVQRAEFITHAVAKLVDAELTDEVFAAMDTNANGEIPVPEYLRVWGQWAREGGKSPGQRIAALVFSHIKPPVEIKLLWAGAKFELSWGRTGLDDLEVQTSPDMSAGSWLLLHVIEARDTKVSIDPEVLGRGGFFRLGVKN